MDLPGGMNPQPTVADESFGAIEAADLANRGENGHGGDQPDARQL